MDMLPEREPESPEPGDEARESQRAEGPQDVGEPNAQPEMQQAETHEGHAPEAEPRHPSFDEAVGEMRQSLRDEEAKEKTGFGSGVKRFVQRIFRRKTAPLPEVTEARLDEFAIPESPHAAREAAPAKAAHEAPAESEAAGEVPEAPSEPARPATESSEFNRLVRNKMTGALPGLDKIEPTVAPKETAGEDEALDYLAPGQTHLKTEPEEPEAPAQPQSILQAVRGQEATEPEDVSSIRQAALEDYVTAPAEEEVTDATPLPRRLRRGWRDMRPIDRTLLTGALAIIGIAILGVSAFAAYTALVPTPSAPAATPTTSVTPVPISISLPGGIVFPLKTGFVQPNGTWNPTGPEWLQGTEICRWVSLPYNVQLDAVLRTLKPGDQIKLSMSNYDSITFKMQKTDEKPVGEIPQLCPEAPALLVILTNQQSASRYVVTAIAQP